MDEVSIKICCPDCDDASCDKCDEDGMANFTAHPEDIDVPMRVISALRRMKLITESEAQSLDLEKLFMLLINLECELNLEESAA